MCIYIYTTKQFIVHARVHVYANIHGVWAPEMVQLFLVISACNLVFMYCSVGVSGTHVCLSVCLYSLGKSLWKLFIEQFDDLLVKILLGAAVVSFVSAFTPAHTVVNYMSTVTVAMVTCKASPSHCPLPYF